MTRKEFLVGSAAFVSAPAFSIIGDAPLGVALVGCGNRGKGALKNLLDAAKIVGCKIDIKAFCDFFPEKAFQAVQEFNLMGKAKLCIGPIAYRDVMAMKDVDVVLLCTPIGFRPLHLMEAVKAGKHVFAEKAFAVDAPGARMCIEAGKIAASKGLAIVAGTQRRHSSGYRSQHQFYVDNIDKIGEISGGVVRWDAQHRQYFKHIPNEPDAFYLIRNWNNFVQLAGDHVVEQHVHNIDVGNWFAGLGDPSFAPLKVTGFGSRIHAQTGNQYDFFSAEIELPKFRFIHSHCRQIDNCTQNVSEIFTTTKGWTISAGSSRFLDPDRKKVDVPESCIKQFEMCSPYIAEHIDLLNCILKKTSKNGKVEYWNEAESCAMSTMTAIAIRESAYSGQSVLLRDLVSSTSSKLYSKVLSPTAIDFEKGAVKIPELGDNEFPKPGVQA